jgi:hypothetical protein
MVTAKNQFTCTNGSFFGPNMQPIANNTTWSGLPTASGNAWYGVAAYQYPTQSDIKYKTDITDIPDCLAFVRALVPKRYRFNNGPPEEDGIVHWGFVAQHVGEVFKEHNFGGHRIDTGENGTSQSILYNELVAVLWKACAEMAEKIEQLEVRDAPRPA